VDDIYKMDGQKKFTTLKFNNIDEFSHPNVAGNVDENV
jgi:hypothetical protein